MVLFDTLRRLDSIAAALRGAARGGRLAHAYLFWGPEGVGKTRTAQALAQLILCSESDPPCGECVECERVRRLTHPDLHIVLPSLRSTEGDERSELEAYAADRLHTLRVPRNATIGIERIRGLKVESSKARVAQGSRVLVLHAADRMTAEASQAALKLIEEPQAGTFLVLTARDPHRLLPTILSRCQRLRFPPLPAEFLVEALKEKDVEARKARLVAALAGGGMGRALAMADADILGLRARLLELIDAPLTGGAPEAAARVQRLGRSWDAEAAQRAAEMLLSWYGDVVAVQNGMPEESLVHVDLLPKLREIAARLTITQIRERLTVLEEMVQAVEQNVSPPLALQAALLRMNGLVEGDPLF